MAVSRLILLFASLAVALAQTTRQAPPTDSRYPSDSGFNLDFEASFSGLPARWSFVNGNGNEFAEALDTAVFYSGSQSLRISSTTAPSTDKAYAYLDIPSSLLKGQILHLTGAIRTLQNDNGFATLFAQSDAGTSGATVNLGTSAPSGTTDWKIYSISVPLPDGVTDVLLGVTLHGSGTAWFDDLRIDIDGTPLEIPIATPTRAQIGWLRQHATPFTTLQPAVDDAELAPLNNIIGNARIVGLGEGTHGTSEFFKMKSRIVSYLARNLGFTVFAMEANMPETYKMNDYVLNGNGDPKALLAGMYFWTWNTQEVLDMVNWMREFNQSGQGRIQFLGFDMQFAGVAMNNVAEFVGRADPALMSTIVNNYGTVALVVNQPSGQPNASQVASATTAAKAVWQQLSANRAQYVQQQNPAAVDWAIQNAQIVLQCVAIQSAGDGTYRDAQMAANIEWIAAQNPGARIVLWAHDYHISRQPGSMGGALAEYFGSSYVTLGQFFHEGTYNAVNSQGLGPNAAEPSFSGSMEYAFHETRVPRQILNLHLANSSDPQSSWFFGTYWDRTIGAVAAPGFALDSLLASEFDAIVFFDQTDPSTLLSFPFAVTTLTLPTGAVGVGYFQDLVSTDSPGPTWTLTQGTLPPGLTLRAGGPLIGTPSASGTYNFAVSVGLGAAKAVAQLQITITD